MTEFDMQVIKHQKSQSAAKAPEFIVLLETVDKKMKLRIKSESSAIFQEYPLAHPITVRIEEYAQTKLPTEAEA